MRILLTTHVFLPDYAAGTEVLTLDTAKELQRLGHHVEICTGYPFQRDLADSTRFDTYEYMGLQVHRFHHGAVPMGSQANVVEAEYNNQFFAQWFWQYLKGFKPDIVHFFHLGLLSGSAIDVCYELNIPMVMTPTDFWLVCPNNQLRLPDNSSCAGPDQQGVNCLKHAVSNAQTPYIARIFSRLPTNIVALLISSAKRGLFDMTSYGPMVRALSQRAGFLRERMNKLDKVIAPTRLMAKTLVDNGLEVGKVICSHYGIRDASSVSRQPHLVGDLRIGFIGGISEHKGVHVLIEAVKSLALEIPLELKIYGNCELYPDYFNKLQRLVDHDNRIYFCGTFPNDRIKSIFADMDVLVVPSIWHENTPLVIYSAQAAGCPVVASDVGGISEVIEHEVNGLLFEPGNSSLLAKTLERLALDRPLLHRLSIHAIKPKSIEDYVNELEAIYHRLLAEEKNDT
jgi:glycosyltransferase involved in cell wall biosynthesis